MLFNGGMIPTYILVKNLGLFRYDMGARIAGRAADFQCYFTDEFFPWNPEISGRSGADRRGESDAGSA